MYTVSIIYTSMQYKLLSVALYPGALRAPKLQTKKLKSEFESNSFLGAQLSERIEPLDNGRCECSLEIEGIWGASI